ncbi:MAG: DUF6427 family protein [Bacteroidota bacterium]|nr:hypothetical protein [Odoribacter sp.]MDP3643225.1 DUF6427 family protein [Bacteroidota bacterium]
MLLKALKSNHAYHYFLIPFIAVAIWFRSFMYPALYSFYPGENMMILYQPVNYLLGSSPLASHITALIFVILLAFLILKLNVQYAFIRSRTFLPPSLFVLITSGMADLRAMHPVYPAALFLILAIDRIFNTYDKESIHSNAFDSGVFLAIGSLFYFNLVFFFPLLWFSFIILRPNVNWREYILTSLGFSLPWLAALSFYVITDRTDELIQIINANFTSHQVFLKGNLPMQIYVGFLVLLTFLGSFFLITQYDEKKISSRRYFKAFFWIFLISVILIIVNPAVSEEIIIILAIPLTYLISNYLIFMKRQVWGEVFLYMLAAGVIALQFAGHFPKFFGYL